MKFCNHCGAKLEGDERFCASCGADTTASAAAPSAAAPAPIPVSVAAPIPVAAMPYPQQVYLQPHPAGIADPYAIHMPVVPAQPMADVAAKHTGVHWTWIILAAVIAGGYYYSQNNTPAAPTPAPAQGTPAAQPAAPGAQPGAAPAQGAPAQPGGAPDQQPEGNPGPNAAILQQQEFAGHWQAIYGSVQVTQGVWTNHSNVAIQSGTLECDQYSAAGADLAQMKMTLTGPVAANASINFNPFQMGAVNSLMSKVNCAIIDITPAT